MLTQLYPFAKLRNTFSYAIFYAVQNIAARQNSAGDIIISTQPAAQPALQQPAFNAESILRNDNSLLQQQQQQQENNNNSSNNNNIIEQNIDNNNQNNNSEVDSHSESSSSDEDGSSDSSDNDSSSSSSDEDSESSDTGILRIPRKNDINVVRK